MQSDRTMKRLVVSAAGPDAMMLAEAAAVIRSGGLVAFPTDTVYGIAADPRSDDAVARLFEFKGRDNRAAVPLIAADIDQARAAGDIGPREMRLAEAFWPGPLSIVVPAAPGLSRAALGGHTTVAIRVPAHVVARELAHAFGFCVTATSANPSGIAAAESPQRVAEILPGIDLLLDAGRAPGGPASTIVALGEDGPVLLRAGAVAWDRVIKSLR
jgi:L-threonylcarbamoyladenylate synthase